MIDIKVWPVYINCNTGEIKIKYYDINKTNYDDLFDKYTSLVSYMNEIDSFIIGEVTIL